MACATALNAIRAAHGVTSHHTFSVGSHAVILCDKSGKRVGSMASNFGFFSYRVMRIYVDESHRNQGVGRLLQIETAYFAKCSGYRYKMPSSLFFTPLGRRHFEFYPTQVDTLLLDKMHKAELMAGLVTE